MSDRFRNASPLKKAGAVFVLALALVVVTIAVPAGQTPPAQPAGVDAQLAAKVPDDPRITTGTLPNGLRYYIRANAQPQNRAELRLVVNAGSVLEDDDQRGLAHFVEHMAFNGTTHFPGRDVVIFLQSLGMRFGAHVNAHTSYDETVYQLQVPTDNMAVLDRSLLIMQDWADAVTFDPTEVDKEKGVILEEWRLGLGADARIQDVQLPVLFAGSKYAERNPIGLPDIVRNATPEQLERFYHDWYRPDLMAVIAVGDFDVPTVETMIKQHFSGIPEPAAPRPRPTFEVPAHADTRYTVATDPEETATTVSVYATRPFLDQTTVGAYRRMIVNQMITDMLSARLAEIAQQPNAPFLAAATDRGLFVRSTEVTSLQARVPDNGIERGLAALFTEAERVGRFGFTQTELDREKLATERAYQRAATEVTSTDSAQLADEYIRNFTQQEPIPGIAYENAMHERFLPEITLAQINAVAQDWIPEHDRVIAVSAPDKAGVTVPTAAELKQTIESTKSARLTPYVDTLSGQKLLDPLPTPGRIVNTTTHASIGITEWQLSNGARVVLMPTTFKGDQILFRAFSPGGTSLAPEADFIPAETADAVVSSGGLGALSETDLEKILAGKAAFAQPRIGEMFEQLDGGASRDDLETLFQLIYLRFTKPRADPEAFKALTEQLKARLADRQADPDAVFEDTMQDLLSRDNPRERPMTPALVGDMSLDKSMAFYRDRFADASDFTFVLVGSFDLDAVKPLAERYLASLPSLHRGEKARDLGIRPPDGIVTREIRKGLDPRSRVGLVFTGPFEDTPANRVVARSMGEMLDGVLQDTLREQLGGTYGVSVETRFQKVPFEGYQITIDFSCDPARQEALTRTMFQVIDRFKFTGPDMGQIADARRTLARDDEVNRRDNRYLINQIVSHYQNGEPVEEIFDMQPYYDQVTLQSVRDAARAYLDASHYVELILRPEAPQ